MDLHGDSPVRRRAASASAADTPCQAAFWRKVSADSLRSLPPSQQNELESLKKESDPEIFSAAILQFAGRQEREGRPELAATFYQSLSEQPGIPAGIRHKAQARAEALLGQGTIGARAEVLFSRFTDEALSPGPIVAMGVAGSAFKISRALSLNLLRQAPVDAFLAKIGANGMGLLSESAAFTLAAKGTSAALGKSQDWSMGAFNKEWLAGTLLLGSIKLGSAAANIGGGNLIRLARSEGQPLSRGLLWASEALQPLGLYSGILLSHGIESSLGLRPRQDAATALVDGAATLLHLYVGGRLAQGLGADRLNRAATALEWRIGNLPRPPSYLANLMNPAPALAVAGKAGERITIPEPKLESNAMMMSELSPESSRFIAELYRKDDFIKSLPGSTLDLLRSLFYNCQGLRDGKAQHDLLILLSATSLAGEPAILDVAIPSIGQALKSAEARPETSHYSFLLTKQIFDDAFHRGDAGRMERLLRFHGNGGKLSDFEAEFAADYPSAGLPKGPPPLPSFWMGKESIYGRIRKLPLSSESHNTLKKWIGMASTPSVPFFHYASRILDKLEYHLGLPEHAPHLDGILRLAGTSPFGLGRLQRMQEFLEKSFDPLTQFKLAELADPEAMVHGRKHPWGLSESTAPSQSNAYLGERAPIQILSAMLANRADLLNPEKSEARRGNRNRILDHLFPSGPRNEHMRAEVFAEAFLRFGDPVSLAISRAILRKDFLLEVQPSLAFKHRVNELSDKPRTVLEGAYYFAPHGRRTKGLMLFRQPEYSVYSQDSARNGFFELMASIVHEYRHHLDIDPQQSRTKDVHLYQEMSAHFTEHLWKAQHGDVHNYSIWSSNSSVGPAMRFHDYFEGAYGHWWLGTAGDKATLKAGRQGP